MLQLRLAGDPGTPMFVGEAIGPSMRVSPGMLAAWRLGVVLSETRTEARIGYLVPAPNPPPVGPEPPGTPETGVLRLAGLAWARAVVPGGFGPTPYADRARSWVPAMS